MGRGQKPSAITMDMNEEVEKIHRVIGLMSGTSMDGVDAAILETDGRHHIVAGDFLTLPYDDPFRDRLRRLGGAGKHDPDDAAIARDVARDLTEYHAKAVFRLCEKARQSLASIDLIGFHGHTLTHCPEEGRSWQIGDGQLLADMCRTDVIDDFRSRDLSRGGQGAPMVPLFHAALLQSHDGAKTPDRHSAGAILNIGGVANITFLCDDRPPLAFDTGPGNALLDDWIHHHNGQAFDHNGELSRCGHVHKAVLDQFLGHPWFDRKPPKSLDRAAFNKDIVKDLSCCDGAATLSACSAAAVQKAMDFAYHPPRWLYVCGGGRHNAAIMGELQNRLAPCSVDTIESLGFSGDAIEAQAFAWLAVRSQKGLALTIPTTTGVARPSSGGVRHHPGRKHRNTE